VGLAVGTLLLGFLNSVYLVEVVVESSAAALFQRLSNSGYEYPTYVLITELGSLPLGERISLLKDWIWPPALA
jgi:hypothetical protein